MALQITEINGIFSVHGNLNSGNAKILSRHMSRFINADTPAFLNLEHVQEMDKSAAHILKRLYVNAMRSNSILSIIGLQNKHILPVMNATRTSYILSDDRI